MSDWMISALALVVSIIGIIIAGLAWRTAKNTLLHQTAVSLEDEYRSADMLYAVKTLWDFYETHGPSNLGQKYLEEYSKDNAWVADLPKLQHIQAEASTLHCQRRIVSHFFEKVARLYLSDVVPRKTIYAIWPENDLRIIPKILIPMELAFAEKLPGPAPDIRHRNLKRLYDDAPQLATDNGASLHQ